MTIIFSVRIQGKLMTREEGRHSRARSNGVERRRGPVIPTDLGSTRDRQLDVSGLPEIGD
jgi:hypothetical protein